MARLFLALRPPDAERAALAGLAQRVAATVGGRPLPADDLHLTLCFLGEVEESRLPALCAAVAATDTDPVELVLEAIDFWAGPRVICVLAAADAGAAQAARLAASLRSAVQQAGFAPDTLPFRPHVTLVRRADPRLASAARWPRALPAPIVLRCGQFVLMRSEPLPGGQAYRVVGCWPKVDAGTQLP